MKKSKVGKITIALFSLCLALSFVMAGCADEKEKGVVTPPASEEDPYVTELSIVTPPTKTAYRPGQKFDPAGMTLVAKWSHGVDEELSATECAITPKGILESGTEGITFAYEGKTVVQEIEMENVRISSIWFDKSGMPRRVLPGNLDLSKIKAVIEYDDGLTVTSTDYTVSSDGEPIDKPAAYKVTVGKHTLDFAFGTYTDSFTVIVTEGIEIVPTRMVTSDQLAAALSQYIGTNFIEKVEGRVGAGGEEGGIPCLKQTMNGDIIRYHIFADREIDCEILLNAASTQVLVGLDDWTPTKMGDMEIGKMFEVSRVETDPVTNEETKTPVDVEKDAYYPGSSSPVPTMSLWANFADVSFGEHRLHEGDNIFEIKIISEYKNMFMAVNGGNLGNFKAFFVPEACDRHELRKAEGSAGACGEYTLIEYYECTACLRTFADEQGTKRRYNIPQREIVEHSPGAPATCLEPQKCTKCGESMTGLGAHRFENQNCETDSSCTVCGEVLKAGHILRIDGIVKSCARCGVVGYQIDVGDQEHISYEKADGSVYAPSLSMKNLQSPDGGIFDQINSLDNAAWKGALIKLNFDAPEAGRYKLRMRCQSTGQEGTGNQDLSEIFEYCVNPSGSDVSGWTFDDVGGQANPATTIGWTDFRDYSIVSLAEIDVKVGENLIVIRRKATAAHGPNVNYFAIERVDYKYSLGLEAEVVSARAGGLEFAKGYGMQGSRVRHIANVFVRLLVPEAQVAEYGLEYYDTAITADMLGGEDKFDTSTVGEHSIPITIEKFGKTFIATFTYVVKEAS